MQKDREERTQSRLTEADQYLNFNTLNDSPTEITKKKAFL